MEHAILSLQQVIRYLLRAFCQPREEEYMKHQPAILIAWALKVKLLEDIPLPVSHVYILDIRLV